MALLLILLVSSLVCQKIHELYFLWLEISWTPSASAVWPNDHRVHKRYCDTLLQFYKDLSISIAHWLSRQLGLIRALSKPHQRHKYPDTSLLMVCRSSISHMAWTSFQMGWIEHTVNDINILYFSPTSTVFIRPSSDGTYYGMVMSVRVSVRPSVRLSVRPSVRLSVRPSGSPSAHFPHFSLTCFDILSWNFAHDFVLMYYRSSSTVVTSRQFL